METLEKAREQIRKAIRQNGPYSHNIASLVLSGVASDHGVIKANELIKEFSLTKLYGIHPVKEEVKTEPKPVPVVEKKVEEPKITPYQRSRQEANVVLEKLYQQLVALPQDKEHPVVYEFVKNNGWEKDAAEIQIIVSPEKNPSYNHPSYNKKIRVFVALNGNGYYHHTSYTQYVRIDTDNWNISFKRNWTPTTKDLPTKVHAKVAEFVRQLKYDYESRVQTKLTEIAVKDKMAVEFPTAKDVYVTGNKATIYTKEGKLAYNISYDNYSIELEGLTRDQLRRVLEIKREKSND